MIWVSRQFASGTSPNGYGNDSEGMEKERERKKERERERERAKPCDGIVDSAGPDVCRALCSAPTMERTARRGRLVYFASFPRHPR